MNDKLDCNTSRGECRIQSAASVTVSRNEGDPLEDGIDGCIWGEGSELPRCFFAGPCCELFDEMDEGKKVTRGPPKGDCDEKLKLDGDGGTEAVFGVALIQG